jgi:hypothetical protein
VHSGSISRRDNPATRRLRARVATVRSCDLRKSESTLDGMRSQVRGLAKAPRQSEVVHPSRRGTRLRADCRYRCDGSEGRAFVSQDSSVAPSSIWRPASAILESDKPLPPLDHTLVMSECIRHDVVVDSPCSRTEACLAQPSTTPCSTCSAPHRVVFSRQRCRRTEKRSRLGQAGGPVEARSCSCKRFGN